MSIPVEIHELQKSSTRGTVRDVIMHLDVLKKLSSDEDITDRVSDMKSIISITYNDRDLSLRNHHIRLVHELCDYLIRVYHVGAAAPAEDNSIDIGNNVISRSVITIYPNMKIEVGGGEVNLDIKKSEQPSEHFQNLINHMVAKIHRRESRNKPEVVRYHIPLKNITPEHLRIIQMAIRTIIKDLNDYHRKFSSKYRSREKEVRLLENHLESLSAGSLEAVGISKQLQQIMKFQYVAEEAADYSSNLREINFGLQAILDAERIAIESDQQLREFGQIITAAEAIIKDTQDMMEEYQ